MKPPTAKFGYVAAWLTVFVAALVPFVLSGAFGKGFASLGLHVSEMYSGGPTVRMVQMAGYAINVHRLVAPKMLQREKAFVQLEWRPVSALPPRVSDLVDIDGDGKPDVRVMFDVPKDPKACLRVNVEPLNPRYEAMHNVAKLKFSELIVRVDDAVLVRVPLAR
ncbi:MAG TPA: hypothetical protein VMI10_20415 [Terriglobales bacterium]|nr:hypothetical protein [Terriglobales bacterium]